MKKLGSVVTKEGGAVAYAKTRIRKANAAFIQLYPVWKSREISTVTKLCICVPIQFQYQYSIPMSKLFCRMGARFQKSQWKLPILSISLSIGA